jgi:predicted nucleic acid-binding protein
VNGWLLDTNILSELRRPRPSAAVVDFIGSAPLDRVYVSAVTFAEIRFGIELLTDPNRRSKIQLWLEHRLRPMFGSRVLPLTEEILLECRLIIEAGRKSGHTYAHPDVLIAATAAYHDLTVVTRDTREFVAAGVGVFNPWDKPQR